MPSSGNPRIEKVAAAAGDGEISHPERMMAGIECLGLFRKSKFAQRTGQGVCKCRCIDELYEVQHEGLERQIL
jgi:hypothetical protein